MSTVSRIRLLAACMGFVGALPSPAFAQALSIPLPPLRISPGMLSQSSTKTVCPAEPDATSSIPTSAPSNTADPITTTPSSSESSSLSAQTPSAQTPRPKQALTWRDSLEQGVVWLDRSQTQFFDSMQTYGAKVMAYTQASQWPALNDRAKSAKVPVMMYHDILPEKEVFFDVTIDELKQHFELIKELGLTPISLEELVNHLHIGTPLPPKPIVLTFDDGYQGHYTHVYPLLKQYGYPATFSVFTDKVDGKIVGRSTVTWAQLQKMAADPLVTIAAHSVTHPPDLTQVPPVQMVREVQDSKKRLEEKLGITINYFTYPEGHYNEAVADAVAKAGYRAALTMDDWNEGYAGESKSLLAIDRFGQSRLAEIAPTASGGVQLPPIRLGFDFQSPVQDPQYVDIEDISLILITGGRPITIHADSRYQVQEILENSGNSDSVDSLENSESAENFESAGNPQMTQNVDQSQNSEITENTSKSDSANPSEKSKPIAGVDGAFFSLESLDSNTLVGPVISQSTGKFIPGNPGENPLLNGRPLVLLNPYAVKFIPFDATRHNSLAGIRQEMADVTDAFVGAAWLVREGQAQPPEAFGKLFDFDAPRDRAFWGINRAGQPVVGVSREPVGSVQLGELLAQAGFRDAVMLDSGASASLAYRGESLMDYIPRPVPHVVGLVPPSTQTGTGVGNCWMASLENLEHK